MTQRSRFLAEKLIINYKNLKCILPFIFQRIDFYFNRTATFLTVNNSLCLLFEGNLNENQPKSLEPPSKSKHASLCMYVYDLLCG